MILDNALVDGIAPATSNEILEHVVEMIFLVESSVKHAMSFISFNFYLTVIISFFEA